MIANKVSSIGIPKIIRGTNKLVKAGPLNSRRVITAIIKPKYMAQSPQNILAG